MKVEAIESKDQEHGLVVKQSGVQILAQLWLALFCEVLYRCHFKLKNTSM